MSWSPSRLWLVVMCAAAAMLGPARAVSAADGQKQVLVLYSTRRDSQIAVIGDRELPRIIDQGLGGGLDYYSEYIDSARFPDPQYQSAFNDFLRLKYNGQRFDVVIAISDAAFQFVTNVRRQLFPDVPLVFFAPSTSTRRVENSTGLIADLPFAGSVALAAQLQPDLRQVFVVSGADATDRAYQAQAKEQLRAFEPGLTFTYLSGLPTDELEARLSKLPGRSIVLFLLVSRDGAHAFFHPLEYVDRVAGVANVPTYCWVDSAIGHGVVGGSMKDQQAETDALAELALRVLNGESADSIPMASPDLNARMVDWRQIRRWGISESRIPAGTVVRFRELSGWDRYKGYITGAIVLVLAQSTLIAALLVQHARRRRAEAQLRASQAELQVSHARRLGAEEAERSRIARDLHDDIGQRIAVLTIELDGLGARLPLATDALRHELGTVSGQALGLARDIESISRTLHSSQLDIIGLVPASAALCRELSGGRLHATFSAEDMPDDLPKDVALCLFRVLQEAANNALKHAEARHLTVTLHGDGGSIRLEVADDGKGFDPASAAHGLGFGLVSMSERLTLLHGEFSIDSRPGAGTRVHAQVPSQRPAPYAAPGV